MSLYVQKTTIIRLAESNFKFIIKVRPDIFYLPKMLILQLSRTLRNKFRVILKVCQIWISNV